MHKEEDKCVQKCCSRVSLSSVLAKNKSLRNRPRYTSPSRPRLPGPCATGRARRIPGTGEGAWRRALLHKESGSALRFPNSGSAPPGACGPSSLVCVYFFIKDSHRQGGGDVCGRPSAKRGRQSSCHYVKELTDCQKGAPGHTDAAGRAGLGSPGHGGHQSSWTRPSGF